MPARTTRSGRFRWWLEGEPDGRLAALVADPDGVLQGPGSVARQRVGRKRFFRVSEPVGAPSCPGSGGPALYVKVFTLPPGWPRLRYWARASKARREAATGRAVRALGLEAAVPVAVAEERRLGLLVRSLSVVPERPGRDLRAVLSDPTLDPKRGRALVESFGSFSRRLHDLGVDQDDFAPNNFLVVEGDAFCLLDFERCRLRRRPLPPERRWHLLAKLHRHHLGVGYSERLRFLRCYLGPAAGRLERRAAWESIRARFRRIRLRDARRAGRAAFREGRNLHREGDVWVVRGREHATVERLELGPARARRAWVTGHQLERLGLPALRAVKLGAGWIEFESPPGCEPIRDPRLVRAVRSRFDAWGRFVEEPEWVSSQLGPLLRNPAAFRVSAH